MLPVSLDCIFFIVPSVFSNVYSLSLFLYILQLYTYRSQNWVFYELNRIEQFRDFYLICCLISVFRCRRPRGKSNGPIIRLNPTTCLCHILGPTSVIVFFVSSESEGKWAGLFMLLCQLKFLMINFFSIEIQIYENSNQGPLTKESNAFTCVRVCLTLIWLSDTPGRILTRHRHVSVCYRTRDLVRRRDINTCNSYFYFNI